MANIYAYSLINKKVKRKLNITALAELKIKTALLKMGNLEVSWFGIINPVGDDFELTDIAFPPQENKPTFVTTKDAEYPTWFFETFTKTGTAHLVRLHGHTHPNFAVTPSSIDMEQFSKIMDEVPYMIQFIINNSLQTTCILYTKEGETGEPLEVVLASDLIKKDIDEKITKDTFKYIGQHFGFGNAHLPSSGIRQPEKKYAGVSYINGDDDDLFGFFPTNRKTATTLPPVTTETVEKEKTTKKKDSKTTTMEEAIKSTREDIKDVLKFCFDEDVSDVALNELMKNARTPLDMIEKICKQFKITKSEYYYNLNILRRSIKHA